MKITCQTCGQFLPKTVLVCPNCGGRQFSDTLSAPPPANANPHATQYHTPLNEQLSQASVWQTPPAQSSPTLATPVALAPSASPPVTARVIKDHAPQASPAPQVNDIPQNIASPNIAPPNIVPSVSPNDLPPIATIPRKPANTMRYAGFIRRAFAEVFDGVLVGILVALAWQYAQTHYKLPIVNSQMLYVQAVVITAVYVLYSAFCISRARQATFGKMLVGLWVFDMQGLRVGFIHALFREVLKVILLPFVFIMWFTARKQALHDLIGRTVVLVDG